MSIWTTYYPNGFDPRLWQEDALQLFLSKVIDQQSTDPNFLLVACPGAGKTKFQLAAAYILRKMGLINWMVVCVPADHLRNQMAKDALSFGLDLYHGTDFCNTRDFDGEVVTYAQVAANPIEWESRCRQFRVFLSSDEVHHLADEKAWGIGYQAAFRFAAIRLSTSGTPFRSDNALIPWVNYQQDIDGNLESKPDFSYGYDLALRDGVCRFVSFPIHDADCKWIYQGKRFEADFKTSLSKQLSSHRRNTVIEADSDWFQGIFCDAHDRLMQVREDGHEDAAGLVVCKDKARAEFICDRIAEWTGEKPLLVHSGTEDASKKIELFARESGSLAQKWIVSVKMVSEGVDIKRLRVGIYASNIMTEMYFRQFVGRFVRVIGMECDETAYVYLYDDPILTGYAEEIKKERNHAITRKDEEQSERQSNNNGMGMIASSFIPLEAIGKRGDHVFDSARYSRESIGMVRAIAKDLRVPEPKVLQIAERLGVSIQSFVSDSVEEIIDSAPTPKTKTELRSELGKRINRLACKLALAKEVEPRLIHKTYNEMVGKKQAELTVDELEAKLHYLSRKLGEIEDEDR